MIGVSEDSINHWEANLVKPKAQQYPKIMEFLGYCPIKYAESFGELVSLYRTHGGYTRRKLAERINVYMDTLTRWQKEISKPNEKLRQRFFDFFHIRHENYRFRLHQSPSSEE